MAMPPPMMWSSCVMTRHTGRSAEQGKGGNLEASAIMAAAWSVWATVKTKQKKPDFLVGL